MRPLPPAPQAPLMDPLKRRDQRGSLPQSQTQIRSGTKQSSSSRTRMSTVLGSSNHVNTKHAHQKTAHILSQINIGVTCYGVTGIKTTTVGGLEPAHQHHSRVSRWNYGHHTMQTTLASISGANSIYKLDENILLKNHGSAGLD